MLSRIWRIAHPLLTLVLVGCCAYLLWRDSYRPGFGGFSPPEPERLSTHGDMPLRNFTGAKWLGGNYELPAGEDHCAVVLLQFEDGKFRSRAGGIGVLAQTGRFAGGPILRHVGPWAEGNPRREMLARHGGQF